MCLCVRLPIFEAYQLYIKGLYGNELAQKLFRLTIVPSLVVLKHMFCCCEQSKLTFL